MLCGNFVGGAGLINDWLNGKSRQEKLADYEQIRQADITDLFSGSMLHAVHSNSIFWWNAHDI